MSASDCYLNSRLINFLTCLLGTNKTITQKWSIGVSSFLALIRFSTPAHVCLIIVPWILYGIILSTKQSHRVQLVLSSQQAGWALLKKGALFISSQYYAVGFFVCLSLANSRISWLSSISRPRIWCSCVVLAGDFPVLLYCNRVDCFHEIVIGHHNSSYLA